MRQAMKLVVAHARGACSTTSLERGACRSCGEETLHVKLGRVPKQLAGAALLIVNLRQSPHIIEHAMQRWASIQRRSHKLQNGFTRRRRPRHAARSALQTGNAGGVPPASEDCSSAAIAARANKRRFCQLLAAVGQRD
jgi:hypothetical protein